MGADLWIPHYTFLYGHLSSKEIDFVMEHLSECDDGTWSLNDNDLMEIEGDISSGEKEDFKNLLNALKEGLKEGYGDLAVQIS